MEKYNHLPEVVVPTFLSEFKKKKKKPTSIDGLRQPKGKLLQKIL